MGQVWLYLYFYIPATKWSGHIHVVTSVTHFRNSEIKQLSPFFFCYALRYWLDIWYVGVYRSSLRFVPIQWFLAEYGPWTLKFGQIFSFHHFISLIWDIDFIFGMRVYNHKLQIKWNLFRLIDFLPTYSRWALKFGQIFSSHHFISLWFEILTQKVIFAGIILFSYLTDCSYFTLKIVFRKMLDMVRTDKKWQFWKGV